MLFIEIFTGAGRSTGSKRKNESENKQWVERVIGRIAQTQEGIDELGCDLYDRIFEAMAEEWEKGHLNIGYPHHPQAAVSNMSFTVNWTFLANNIKNENERNLILRGAEVNSRWGTAIGQYYTPCLPWIHPYQEIRF